MTELRVPTLAVPAEVACADGRSFSGRIFIPAAASHHAGPMRAEEWINEPLSFFPFLPDDGTAPFMLDKHTVLFLTLAAGESDDTGSDEDLGVHKRVAVECGDRRLEGLLHIDMPENHRRVQDYLNRPELFVRLIDGSQLHLVQRHHITRVIELQEA